MFGTLFEWLKQIIEMIRAWLKPRSGPVLAIPWSVAADPPIVPPPGWLHVPVEIAPDPERLGDRPCLKIPLEVK